MLLLWGCWQQNLMPQHMLGKHYHWATPRALSSQLITIFSLLLRNLFIIETASDFVVVLSFEMPLNDWKWDILTQSNSRYEDKIILCLKVSMPFLLLCLQPESSQKHNNEMGFSDWSFFSTEFGSLLSHIFMVSFLVASVLSMSEFSVATVSVVMAEIWKWECYSTLATPSRPYEARLEDSAFRNTSVHLDTIPGTDRFQFLSLIEFCFLPPGCSFVY